MKKILTALLIVMALSVPAHAEQEETNIDGEWYITPYFYERGEATKDDKGNYYVADESVIQAFYNDGTMETQNYLIPGKRIQKMEPLQASDGTFLVYKTEPGQPDQFSGYIFLDDGDGYVCYSAYIYDSTTPVLFSGGKIYGQAANFGEDEESGEDISYLVSDDTLYMMSGNEYLAGEITKFSEGIFLYDTRNRNDESDSGGSVRSELHLFVQASLLDQTEAPQDAEK